MERLRKFIEWGDDIVKRAEHHDWQASMWCGFVNLTVLSVVLMVIVGVLLWLF